MIAQPPPARNYFTGWPNLQSNPPNLSLHAPLPPQQNTCQGTNAYPARGCQHHCAYFFLPARLPEPFLGGALPRRFNRSSFSLALHTVQTLAPPVSRPLPIVRACIRYNHQAEHPPDTCRCQNAKLYKGTLMQDASTTRSHGNTVCYLQTPTNAATHYIHRLSVRNRHHAYGSSTATFNNQQKLASAGRGLDPGPPAPTSRPSNPAGRGPS